MTVYKRGSIICVWVTAAPFAVAVNNLMVALILAPDGMALAIEVVVSM